MPAVSAPGTRERLRPGQGRGGVHPPEYGGGGDGARGDGAPDYDRRLYRAKLALLLIIGSICVLFLTVTVALMWWESSVAIDGHNRGIAHAWMPVALPTRLLLWNTLILLLSSITVEMARRSIAREMVLAPIQAIANRAGPWTAGSLAGNDCGSWRLVHLWAMFSLERAAITRISSFHDRDESRFLFAFRRTRGACLGGNNDSALCHDKFSSAPAN